MWLGRRALGEHVCNKLHVHRFLFYPIDLDLTNRLN